MYLTLVTNSLMYDKKYRNKILQISASEKSRENIEKMSRKSLQIEVKHFDRGVIFRKIREKIDDIASCVLRFHRNHFF